jgi:2-hydroxy-6-oxonona-2,4-dienedioate hydrolase
MLINNKSYNFTSMFVKANGIKTHMYVAGEGEPLVLVHGGAVGTNALTWKNNIEELAKHYRVYAPDRIGFGLTDKPIMTYNNEVLVRHLADVIDALCLDKIHILGHSMGAYGVSKYTVDNPDRVKKLVLVASGSTSTAMGINFDSEGRQALHEAVTNPTFENVNALNDSMNHRKDDLIEETEECMRLVALEGSMHVQRELHEMRRLFNVDANLRQRNSLLHRLPEITIPTILLWGRQDRFSPFENGLKLKAMLPNLKDFHIFENSSHTVQHDEPERFNKTVLDFLAQE